MRILERRAVASSTWARRSLRLTQGRWVLRSMAALAFACISSAALAALPIVYPTQKLTPLAADDNPTWKSFGQATAIDGSTLVVGVPTRDNFAGAVALFSRSSSGSWNRFATLKGSSTAREFGRAVAVSSGHLLVASKASIYHYALTDGAWRYVEKIGLGFGADVKHVRLSKNLAAVNVVDMSAGTTTTYVRVFGFTDQNKLKSLAKLTPADSLPYEFQGDVAVSDTHVVIGGSYYGTAYVYSCGSTSCRLQQQLVPSDQDNDNAVSFGTAVAVRGSVLVVSAPYEISPRAYVFALTKGGWAETGILLPDDVGTSLQSFGLELSLSADRLLVAGSGSPQQGISHPHQFTYSYSGSTFTPLQTLSGAGEPKAVAISGRTAVSQDRDYRPDHSVFVNVYTVK